MKREVIWNVEGVRRIRGSFTTFRATVRAPAGDIDTAYRRAHRKAKQLYKDVPELAVIETEEEA